MSIVLCPVAEAASRLGSDPVILPDTVAAVCDKYGLSPFLAEVRSVLDLMQKHSHLVFGSAPFDFEACLSGLMK